MNIFNRRPRYYITPPVDLLTDPPAAHTATAYDGHQLAAFLSRAAPCVFRGHTIAPQLVQYRFDLSDPFDLPKINKAVAALSAVIHRPVEVLTSSKAHFALAIPSETPQTVPIKRPICTREFDQGGGLTTAAGVWTDSTPALLDLAEMPHTLIAGATGSGKSVLLHCLITGLLYKHTPATLKMIMIDPKQTELNMYTGIPHLLRPICTRPADAATLLADMCREMDARYKEMKKHGLREIGSLYPPILIVIDELADLMLSSRKTVEPYLVRLAQLGRAAGMHLLIATQRPTTNVVTGLIKANIPCRICLRVASWRDSMTIIDRKGGELLQGRGDGLIVLPTSPTAYRFQGAYISQGELLRVCDYWRGPAARIR
ncbi:MAG: DUF87 domain-containing protein [Oscillospiraceae bacterium]|nr:DUF87 domain-containing protein [Oscillospiraceae bacterium]MBO5917866.1 DUF87 domain-containing protein [Oscillospiraceae bacterium]